MPVVVALSLIAAILAGGPAVAQPIADDLRPLVKLHDTHLLVAGPSPPVSSTDTDIFVARGGDLVQVTVTRQVAGNGSFQTEIAQGTGSPDALAALNSALAAGHPGQQGGVCGASFGPLGSTFRYTVTWFGLGSRSTTFTATNDGTGTAPCTDAEVAMVRAIVTFAAAVLADPATDIRRSTCVRDADCGGGQVCCPVCAVPDCPKQCQAPAANGGCPLIP